MRRVGAAVTGARRFLVAWRLAFAGAGALVSPPVGAMGGHFEVDDASVLAPQRCQVELWALRGEVARIGHVGPSCRVGPLELGLAFDRLSEESQRDSVIGVQAKWVTSLAPQLDIGVAASASRDTTRGINLWTAYAPLTWSIGEAVQLHANLGVDRLGERGRSKRLGVAGGWAIGPLVTLLAERLWAFDEAATRIGLRFALGDDVSLDASGARISGSGNRVWGLGLTFEFGR